MNAKTSSEESGKEHCHSLTLCQALGEIGGSQSLFLMFGMQEVNKVLVPPPSQTLSCVREKELKGGGIKNNGWLPRTANICEPLGIPHIFHQEICQKTEQSTRYESDIIVSLQK